MSSEQARRVADMLWKAKQMAQQQKGEVDYARRRAVVEERHAQQKIAEGIEIGAARIGGVETECLIPAGCRSDDLILYIHGGGFLTGSARSSRGYASFLARAGGVRVYTISYRLAPDNPWPAAPQDCMAVYRALRTANPQAKIALVGGSAGGNLCLTTMLRAKGEGVQLPCAAALYSPVTEQTGALPSRRINGSRDCMISSQIDEQSKAVYFPGEEATNPDISPLYGDLRGLPPMLITVDADEVLKDDAILLAAYAREAGVETEFRVSQGLFHDYPSMGPQLPEAAEIMKATLELLRRAGMHLAEECSI